MMTMIENDSGMNFVCKIPFFFPASPWGMPKPLELKEGDCREGGVCWEGGPAKATRDLAPLR
jgi:hypothetical protein